MPDTPAPSVWAADHPWHDFYHAVGAGMLAFSDLEYTLFLLFERYLALPLASTIELFPTLHNRARVDLITSVVTRVETDPEAVDAVLYALKGFNRCAENRNVLAHSTPQESGTADFILTKTASDSPARINVYRLSVADVREVADATRALHTYATLLWGVLHIRRVIGEKGSPRPLPPWPNRPRIPGKLTPLRLPEDPEDEQSPPGPLPRWLVDWEPAVVPPSD